MAGKAYIKNSSTQWKIIKKAYYKVGQSWVPIQKAYVKVGNLWKKVFDSASQAPIGTLTRILYKGYAQNGGVYVGDLPTSWVTMGPDSSTWGTGTPTYLWGEDGTWDANGGTISFYRRGFYYNSTNDRNTYTLITGTNAEGNVDAGGGGDKLRNASGYISDYDDKYLWYVTSATNTAGVTGFSAANPTYVTKQSPTFSLEDYDNFYFQDPASIPSGGVVKFDFYIADEWYRKIDKTKSFMEFYLLDDPTDGLDMGTKIGSNVYINTITSSSANDVLSGTYDFAVPSTASYLGKYLAARMTLRNSYTEWYIYTPVEGNVQVSTEPITATPIVEVAPTITKKDSNQTQGYYLTGNAGRWTPDATGVEYGWQYSDNGTTGWTDVRYAVYAGVGLVYPIFVGSDTSENGSYDYLIPLSLYTNSSGTSVNSSGKYLRFWSQGAVNGVKAVKTYTAAIGPIYKAPTVPGTPEISYYEQGSVAGNITAGFVWSASTSFYRYQIERKTGSNVWNTIATGITTNGDYFSKYTVSVPLGAATYRIVAVNEDGVKAYSQEVAFTASGLPGAFNISSATKEIAYAGEFQDVRDVKTFWGASTNAEYYAVRYQGTNTAPGTSGRESTWVEIQPDFNEWSYTTKAPATDDTRANLRYIKTTGLLYSYGTWTITTSGKHKFNAGQTVWISWPSAASSDDGVYTVQTSSATSFTVTARGYSSLTYNSSYRPVISTGWLTASDYPTLSAASFYGGERQADVYTYYRVAVRAENSASVAELNPTYSNGGTASNIQWFELSGTAPSGLSISEDSKTTTTVDITASITDPGSSAFSKYQWSTNGTSWTDDTTSPVNVTGLTAATDYTLYVRAVNAEGIASESKTLSVTTKSGVGAFNIVSATKGKINADVANSRRITIVSETPTNGAKFEHRIEGTNSLPTATTRTWTELRSFDNAAYTNVAASGNTTITYDAVNYSYYRVSLRCRPESLVESDASYNGGGSELSPVYLEASGTKPNAITMPDSATATKTSLSIDYTLPTGADTGSAPLNKTEYKVGTGSWTATTADPLSLTSLDAGTDYTVYMRATNSDGLVSDEASKTYTTTKVPLAFTINNVTRANGTAKTVAISKEITLDTETAGRWDLGKSNDTAFSGANKYLIEAWPSNSTTMTEPTGTSSSPGYSFQGTNAYDFDYYTGYGQLNVRVKGTGPVPSATVTWSASTNAKSYKVIYKIGTGSNVESNALTTTSFTYEFDFSEPVAFTLVSVTAYSNDDKTGDSIDGTMPTTVTVTPTQAWSTGTTKSVTKTKPFVAPTATTPTPSFSRFWQTATTTTRQQGLNWYWNNPTVNDDGEIFGWDWEVRVSDVTNYTVEPHRWGWATWTGRTVPSGTNRGMQPYNTTKGYRAQVYSGSGSSNNDVTGTPHHNRIRSTENLPSSNSFRYGRIRVVLKGTNNQYYPQSWSGNV